MDLWGCGKDGRQGEETYRLDSLAFWLIRSKNVRNGLRLISEVLWISDVMTRCDRHATRETGKSFCTQCVQRLEKEASQIMDTVEKNVTEIDEIWMSKMRSVEV